MAEDPIEELAELGTRPVPPVDPGFADRLESRLRATHAAAVQPGRRPLSAWLPRIGVAFAVLALMVVGAVALTDRPAGVPVSTGDGDSEPPADFAAPPAEVRGGEAAPATPGTAADGTPTPTPIPTSTAVAAVSAVSEATTTPSARSTPGTDPGTTPTAAARPELSLTPEPVGTPVPPPTPTSTPQRPTPTVEATPTPTVEPRPTPTPTVEPEPEPIEARCLVRIAGDSAGVTCSWRAPATDRPFVRIEVLRSRNGAEATVVSEQRPETTDFVDRDVALGDRVVYVIRAVDGQDRIVAASARHALTVMPSR